jgi:hypothetical protein
MGLSESVMHYLNQIKDQFDLDNQVSFLFKGASLSRHSGSTGHVDFNMRILGESIALFLCKQGDIENLIWNVNTRNWFAAGNIKCPHTLPTVALDVADSLNIEVTRSQVIETIKVYLQDLFNCELPQEWFLDCHVEQLHQNLKRLVGEFAIIHSGNGYPLTLGGIVIILASVHRDISSTQGWLTNISWQKCEYTSVCIGENDKQTYQLLFSLLVNLFQILKINRYTGLPLIQSVNLNSEKIEIILNHNFSIPDKKNRKSLIEVFESNLNYDCGDLCQALYQVQSLLQDRVKFYLNESLLTVLDISAN